MRHRRAKDDGHVAVLTGPHDRVASFPYFVSGNKKARSPRDQIDFLIDRAHRLVGETSVFEVLDLQDRQEAYQLLVELYGLVEGWTGHEGQH